MSQFGCLVKCTSTARSITCARPCLCSSARNRQLSTLGTCSAPCSTDTTASTATPAEFFCMSARPCLYNQPVTTRSSAESSSLLPLQQQMSSGVGFGPTDRVKQQMISLCKASGSGLHTDKLCVGATKRAVDIASRYDNPAQAPSVLQEQRTSEVKLANSTAEPYIPEKSFYRRELPTSLVSFTSAAGRKLFKESLNEGYAEGYFNLAGNFTVQSEPAYCGPSSLAMVLNALEVDPGRTWKGVWRWYSDELLESCRTESDLKANGITFDQFLCLASSHAQVIAKRGAEASREEFLSDIKYVTQRVDVFMVLSFSRKHLGQTGDGHFSPIGAYHPASNKALVLDSARYKYPSWFGDVDELYNSLQPVDTETGLPRGYFLISRKDDISNLGTPYINPKGVDSCKSSSACCSPKRQ